MKRVTGRIEPFMPTMALHADFNTIETTRSSMLFIA